MTDAASSIWLKESIGNRDRNKKSTSNREIIAKIKPDSSILELSPSLTFLLFVDFVNTGGYQSPRYQRWKRIVIVHFWRLSHIDHIFGTEIGELNLLVSKMHMIIRNFQQQIKKEGSQLTVIAGHDNQWTSTIWICFDRFRLVIRIVDKSRQWVTNGDDW
jgi:predicted AlkP superfamily pyrophosphatase or phosphodiesterase